MLLLLLLLLGDRLKEATKINLSLSALGNVISALVDSKSGACGGSMFDDGQMLAVFCGCKLAAAAGFVHAGLCYRASRVLALSQLCCCTTDAPSSKLAYAVQH
jgi:hypothetical protein